jgi:diguanylate cyclase (GGDEF)-like protein/PAS domain S-box-containing protein
VFDALGDGLLVLDADRIVRYVNPAVERITGYEAAAWLDNKPRLRTDNAEAARSLGAALHRGRSFRGVVRAYRRDGPPFWNAVHLTPVHGAQGSVTHWVMLMRDVSEERARTEAAAEHLDWMARFYRALAETRALLHQADEDPPDVVLTAWCERVVAILDVRVAWVGRLPAGAAWVEVVAAGGPAREYTGDLAISVDGSVPEGQGPVGTALREMRPVFMHLDDPRFLRWKARAARWGLCSMLAAAAPVGDGSRMVIGLYWPSTPAWEPELADIAVRLVQDAAHWFNQDVTGRRLRRVEQYREAHRALQARLLAAEAPEEVLTAVADILARSTDARGITILVPAPGEATLERRITAGPLAPFLDRLPTPSLVPAEDAPESLSARAWRARAPVLVRHPAADPRMPDHWREPPLATMGVIGAWPIPGPGGGDPLGVITITAEDPDTFVPELRQLVDEIVQSAALAWAQIRHREGLRRVQTYQRAALQAQHAFLRLPDAPALYRELVRVLVDQAGCAAAYVAVPAPSGQALELAAVAAKSPTVAEALSRLTPALTEDTPWGWLLCSRAFRTGQAVGPVNPWEQAALGIVQQQFPLLASLKGAVAWPIGVEADGRPSAVLAVLTEALEGLSEDLTYLLAQLATSLDVALKKLREQALIAEWAWRDPLTGIGNRRALDDYLEQALAHAARTGDYVAVCLGDLDDFKLVNDQHGHVVGDHVLQAFAEILRGNVREGDFVGRWGGDEFVMVVSGLADRGALEVVLRRVATVLERPVRLPGRQRFRLRASVGIALARGGSERPQDLLRQADQALYYSKTHPSADAVRWTFYEELGGQNGVSVGPHGVRERLEVVFQPIWDVELKRAVALEALARWKTDAGGLALPHEFLEQLSHVGRRQLTDAVVDRATAVVSGMQEGRDAPPLGLNINVWPELVVDPAWRRSLLGRVRRRRWDPERITLEIVETPEGRYAAPQLPRALLALRRLGFRVALDDVGSGESSLVRLRRLPVDAIKLDVLLMRDLGRYPEGLLYIEALEMLARDLGLEVVVEGVETSEALNAVAHLGVKRVQGFAVARPLPVAPLHRRLQALCRSGLTGRPSLVELYALTLRDHRPGYDMRRQGAALGDFPDADRCPTHDYLRRLGVGDSAVGRAHQALHTALRDPSVPAGAVADAWARMLDTLARAAREPAWLAAVRSEPS